MPREYICSFCGRKIPPGKGKMVVFNDGRIYYFCSSKCEKNMLKLGRNPKEIPWTEYYRKEKLERLKSAEQQQQA
ncbi:MAG: 50S ribosomal protein L24e [bacterium]|nr:50S ribosomal protein L24e [bacterium]